MTRETFDERYCTAQEARDIIRKARKRVFMLSVQTVQIVADNHDKYYTGLGNVEVSRKYLLTKAFHNEQGKYYMFSQVVNGKAVVKITDTGRILFIG